jgi:hypothetical protein
MSKNHPSNNSLPFQSLSEAEQENLVGGQTEDILATTNFFFQKTDISTEAENNVNLSPDESGSQATKYTLSQITLASSITFTLPNLRPDNLHNFIGRMISGLFS